MKEIMTKHSFMAPGIVWISSVKENIKLSQGTQKLLTKHLFCFMDFWPYALSFGAIKS